MDISSRLFAGVLLVWQAPEMREDGSLLLGYEISHYTLFIDGEAIDSMSGNGVEVTPAKGCQRYTVSATDTNNLESLPSNELKLCNRGKKDR
jgi:hypothetical protein